MVKINHDGKKRNAFELLGYKGVGWDDIQNIWSEIKNFKVSDEVKDQILLRFYSRYTGRLEEEIKQLQSEGKVKISGRMNFKRAGLSNEVKKYLYRPSNFSEAKNLPGMTPAAASILLSYVKK